MKRIKSIILLAMTVTFLTGGSLYAEEKHSDFICEFPGKRVLEMEIYQDDKLVLQTLFDSPDCRKAPFFWKRSGDVPFSTDKKLRIRPLTLSFVHLISGRKRLLF